MDPENKPKRFCNRHDDCDAAEQRLLDRHPGKPRWQVLPVDFHCHDDCCEECFGY